MAQWINVFGTSVLNPTRLPMLCRNSRAVALVQPGLTAGWLIDEMRKFQIFKIHYRSNFYGCLYIAGHRLRLVGIFSRSFDRPEVCDEFSVTLLWSTVNRELVGPFGPLQHRHNTYVLRLTFSLAAFFYS